MLVCNLTTDCAEHVDTVIDFAIKMQEEARWGSCMQLPNPQSSIGWRNLVGSYRPHLVTCTHGRSSGTWLVAPVQASKQLHVLQQHSAWACMGVAARRPKDWWWFHSCICPGPCPCPCRHIKFAQGEPVQIRIGIHTGPVVGGVMGTKAPRFSIYGDTVNV